MPSDDLVTAAEAAEILGVHVATLHRLTRSGALSTAMKAPGLRGARFFLRSDVEALRDSTGGAAA
jgi:DNA-binding transcriptional MerR regulator